MSGWKAIVSAYSEQLAENLATLQYPQLNGLAVGDSKILFGQQHVRAHGGPPRVVFVADGWGWAPPRTANPATVAVPRGETYQNATQTRSLATMMKRIVVHCWAVRYTGNKPDPDPDGGDLDALDTLVRAIVVTAKQITSGLYVLGDGNVVSSKKGSTQHVRLGVYATFALSLGTPVEDLPLGGTAQPSVKPQATTQMVPYGGGTPETGCTT